MTRWLWYPVFSFYFGTFCRRISFCVGECIWNMYLPVPVHCATSWCRMCKFELVSESSRALQGMSLMVHFQRNKYLALYRLAAVCFSSADIAIYSEDISYRGYCDLWLSWELDILLKRTWWPYWMHLTVRGYFGRRKSYKWWQHTSYLGVRLRYFRQRVGQGQCSVKRQKNYLKCRTLSTTW